MSESQRGQEPWLLWIGCSDSRVSERVLNDAPPGTVFVHRNIANQLPQADNNALSVLQYAVDHLHVKEVAIVGHTDCGGVAASIPPAKPLGNPLDSWLTSLRYVAESQGIKDATELMKVNVRAQVDNLANSDTIRRAWERGQMVWLNGWIYNIETGLLEDLCCVPQNLPVQFAASTDTETGKEKFAEQFSKYFK